MQINSLESRLIVVVLALKVFMKVYPFCFCSVKLIVFVTLLMKIFVVSGQTNSLVYVCSCSSGGVKLMIIHRHKYMIVTTIGKTTSQRMVQCE